MKKGCFASEKGVLFWVDSCSWDFKLWLHLNITIAVSGKLTTHIQLKPHKHTLNFRMMFYRIASAETASASIIKEMKHIIVV